MNLGCAKTFDLLDSLGAGKAGPAAPIIISPTTAANYNSLVSAIHIVGCFNTDCSVNVNNLTVQATGAGTLLTTTTNFTFDATMTDGETRVFSFTFTNEAGKVSPEKTLTITYSVGFELSPLSVLFNSGAGSDTPVNSVGNTYILDFISSLASLPNAEITSNGYVFSSGGLNPQ